jgi:predicted chitinase
MKISEVWTEKKPTPMAPQGVGSGIIVDKNYKEPTTVPTPVAKPAAPAPVAQPVATPVAKPAPVTKSEPAPFNPASNKNTLISVAKSMGITALNDLSNLLAQAQVETANWTKATENFNYTDPTRIYRVFTSNFPSPQHAAPYVGNQVALANRALANKNGNGDEASGDGWNFRGRGFIHLTGRELYAAAGAALHPENPGIYLQNPTLLSSNPVESAKAAVWYYLHKVGKGKTSKQASKTVNPAGLKHSERGQAAKAIKQQLAAATTQTQKKRGRG